MLRPDDWVARWIEPYEPERPPTDTGPPTSCADLHARATPTAPPVRHRARGLRGVPERPSRRRPRVTPGFTDTGPTSTSRPTPWATCWRRGQRVEVVLSDGWYRAGWHPGPTPTGRRSRSWGSCTPVGASRPTGGVPRPARSWQRTSWPVRRRTAESSRALVPGQRRRPRPRALALAGAPDPPGRGGAPGRRHPSPPTARSSTSARTSTAGCASATWDRSARCRP